MIVQILLAIVVVCLFVRLKTHRNNTNYKTVPVVGGALPLIGHGLQLNNILEFIKSCQVTYGNVFEIKFFRRKLVVVCDPSLKHEFFGHVENDMSLYKVLDTLFFVDAFSDDHYMGQEIIKIVKKLVGVKYDVFAPKIIDEATQMTTRMKTKCSGKIDLAQEMIKFVSATSCRCFVGYTMSDEFYDLLIKFTHLQNKIVILTYFLPKWLIKTTVNRRLRKYRYGMTKLLDSEIQKYRDDLAYNESQLIRYCVDYVDETGRTMNNSQIGDVIVCLLYVSSENTALGLTNALTDLIQHPHMWTAVKNCSEKYLQNSDYRAVFNEPIIDACVMESARLHSHMFALNRKPESVNVIGDYYVGSCDAVALCEPPMMCLETASNFSDPTKYDPLRFITKNESKSAYDIMTWGAGGHLCPGKIFAIYEIKAALALITNNFWMPQLRDCVIGDKNYFSPSAFSERHVLANFGDINLPTTVFYDNREVRVTKYNSATGVGYLISGLLCESDQQNICDHIYRKSNGTDLREKLADFPVNNACPIAWNNLAYTSTSSCEPLVIINTYANIIKNFCINNSIYDLGDYNFDSIYCQLFHVCTTMRNHVDDHVSVGLSISLGSSCEFQFGDGVINLQSGDIFVSDFSKTIHGINSINDQIPEFLNTNVFGDRCRLSIQIRDNNKCKQPEPISDNKFIEMLKN